ncbi:hypothetical protein DRO91_10275 [Candidatus Heimdallarchaeota archaeon]|nr:MAG: hypothetical protein DRO91_10275 [Candidatus Heimdallarchaeota archaeon]
MYYSAESFRTFFGVHQILGWLKKGSILFSTVKIVPLNYLECIIVKLGNFAWFCQRLFLLNALSLFCEIFNKTVKRS